MRRPAARTTLTVAALLLTTSALAACGSDDDEPTATDTTPAPTVTTTENVDEPATDEATPPAEDRKVIEVTMTGSKVDPAPGVIKVDKGTKIRLIVTRDTDGEIHVHGLGDIHAHAHANEPAQLDFVAKQQGSYEVEAHDPDRLLFTLQVQ